MERVIKVNTNRLKADAADIESHIRSIEMKIAELKEHSLSLDAMWDEPGSEAAKAAFSEDIEALQQKIGSIVSMNEFERFAGQQYDKCESKVADLVNQIRIR